MLVKWLLGLALIGHGIGHITGFLSAWTKMKIGFSSSSWIFSSNVSMADPIGKLFGLIWLMAAAVLVAGGVGLVTNLRWWVTMTLVGSVLSLVAVVPWWKTVVPGARIGLVFNLLVLLMLLTPLKNWLLNLIEP